MSKAFQAIAAKTIGITRVIILAAFTLILIQSENRPTFAQEVSAKGVETKHQQIAETSVYITPPTGFTVKTIKNGVGHSVTRSTIQVLEEPKIVHKIWHPRFTDREAADAFREVAGYENETLFTLEIDGETIPMKKYYRGSEYRSAWFYKALFDADNSIIVSATIYEGDPISEEDLLRAFRTIRIEVEEPLSTFDDAAFEANLIAPFEYALGSRGAAMLKSYPEIDEDYKKPSIDIGIADVYALEEGEKLGSLAQLGFLVFPVSRGFYGSNLDKPDHEKIDILSEETVIIGPGRAHKIVASYKSRLGIQYVWHLGGLDFLFFFAKGDEKNIAVVEDEILHTAQSVRLKSDEVKIQGLSVPTPLAEKQLH